MSGSSSHNAAWISTQRGPRYHPRAPPWHGASGSVSTACLAITLEAREIVDEIATREATTDRDDDVHRRRHRGKAGGVPWLDLALADEEKVAPDIPAHVGIHLELVARAAARVPDHRVERVRMDIIDQRREILARPRHQGDSGTLQQHVADSVSEPVPAAHAVEEIEVRRQLDADGRSRLAPADEE